MNIFIISYLKQKHVIPKISFLVFCFFLGFAGNAFAYELGSDGKCYTAVWDYYNYANHSYGNHFSPDGIINVDYINVIYPNSTLECDNEPDRIWNWGAYDYLCPVDRVDIYGFVLDYNTGVWTRISGSQMSMMNFDGYEAQLRAGLEARFGPELTGPENFDPNDPTSFPAECCGECGCAIPELKTITSDVAYLVPGQTTTVKAQTEKPIDGNVTWSIEFLDGSSARADISSVVGFETTIYNVRGIGEINIKATSGNCTKEIKIKIGDDALNQGPPPCETQQCCE